MIRINIINSYISFDQVWTIIPQEIWSNHQQGKMVKIKNFDWERGISDFWPSKWSIGLKHDLKSSIASFYLMEWLKILLKINWIDSWFSVNWSKVNCTLKSQTLTFWSKASVKDHNSSKHVKIWNLFIKNQKVKISFWKVKISKLRNFSKCLKLHVFS